MNQFSLIFCIVVWISISYYMACQFLYFNFSLWSVFMHKKNSYHIINALEIFPILFRDPSIFFQKLFFLLSSIFFLIPEIMRNIWDPIRTFGHFVINSWLFGEMTKKKECSRITEGVRQQKNMIFSIWYWFLDWLVWQLKLKIFEV